MTQTAEQGIEMLTRTTLTAKHGKCGCGIREKILSGKLPSDYRHNTPTGACDQMIWPEAEDLLLDELS